MLTNFKHAVEARLGHKIDRYRWAQVEYDADMRLSRGEPIGVAYVLAHQHRYETFVERLHAEIAAVGADDEVSS